MQNTEKKEIIAVLPTALQSTKEFTENQKLVLGYLVTKNGMDYVEENGYFFATNKSLSDELGISEKSFISITKKLSNYNFISRKSGKRGHATEYIINEDVINNYKPIITEVNTEGKGKYNSYTEVNTEGKGKYNKEIKKLTKQVEELSSQILELQQVIKNIITEVNTEGKGKYNSYTEVENELKVSTDIDTDIDKEKDLYYNKNINLNKIYYLYNINNLNKYNKINNFIEYINKEKNNNKLLEEKKVEVTVTNVTDITDNSNNENNTPNENNKNMNRLNEKIKESLVKMNEIKSIDELNKKIILFQEWFNKKYEKDNSIDKELFQKELVNKSNEIFEKLYSNDERKFNVAEVGIKLVQIKKKLSQLETISNDEKNDIINFINSNISFIYFIGSSSDLLKQVEAILSKLEEIQVMECEPITQNAK